MKVETQRLTGAALDWAVAVALGWDDILITDYDDPVLPDEVFFDKEKSLNGVVLVEPGIIWRPAAKWAQSGPIIDQMEKGHFFFLENNCPGCHCAYSETEHTNTHGLGPTLLIAAMRCYVASKLGDEIEIPEELVCHE